MLFFGNIKSLTIFFKKSMTAEMTVILALPLGLEPRTP